MLGLNYFLSLLCPPESRSQVVSSALKWSAPAAQTEGKTEKAPGRMSGAQG